MRCAEIGDGNGILLVEGGEEVSEGVGGWRIWCRGCRRNLIYGGGWEKDDEMGGGDGRMIGGIGSRGGKSERESQGLRFRGVSELWRQRKRSL